MRHRAAAISCSPWYKLTDYPPGLPGTTAITQGIGSKLKSSQSPLFLKRDCEDSMLLSAIPGLVVEIDFFLGRVAEMDFPVNIFLSRYKRGLGQLLIIA